MRILFLLDDWQNRQILETHPGWGYLWEGSDAGGQKWIIVRSQNPELERIFREDLPGKGEFARTRRSTRKLPPQLRALLGSNAAQAATITEALEDFLGYELDED